MRHIHLLALLSLAFAGGLRAQETDDMPGEAVPGGGAAADVGATVPASAPVPQPAPVAAPVRPIAVPAAAQAQAQGIDLTKVEIPPATLSSLRAYDEAVARARATVRRTLETDAANAERRGNQALALVLRSKLEAVNLAEIGAGTLAPPPGPVMPASMNGRWRMDFTDGRMYPMIIDVRGRAYDVLTVFHPRGVRIYRPGQLGGAWNRAGTQGTFTYPASEGPRIITVTPTTTPDMFSLTVSSNGVKVYEGTMTRAPAEVKP